jgi:hypothetical protein
MDKQFRSFTINADRETLCCQEFSEWMADINHERGKKDWRQTWIKMFATNPFVLT